MAQSKNSKPKNKYRASGNYSILYLSKLKDINKALSQKIIIEICSLKDITSIKYSFFNHINFNLDPQKSNILPFLEKYLTEDLKSVLFSIILFSRETNEIDTASSNAATILNRCNYSFSNKDLHGVRILNADLSGNMFIKTNFKDSNFKATNFSKSSFYYSNLENCHLEDAKFGIEVFNTNLDKSLMVVMAFSNCGKYAAIGGGGAILYVLEIKTEKIIWNFKIQGDWNILTLAFSNNSVFLASGSRNSALYLLNLETGESICLSSQDNHSILSVSFSPDDKILASCSKSGYICIWDIKTSSCIKIIQEILNPNIVVFSPCGKYMVASSTLSLKIFKTNTWEIYYFINSWPNKVKTLNFLAKGKFLVFGTDKHVINIWHLDEAKKIIEIAGDITVSIIEVSKNGEILAFSGKGKSIWLWSIETQQIINKFICSREVCAMSFSPCGRYLLSGNDDGKINIFEIDIQNNYKKFEGHQDPISTVAYSPTGEYFISGNLDKKIKIWSAKTYELLGTLNGHTGYIASVSISPCGLMIASGSSDRTLRIWDAKTYSEIISINDSNRYVTSVCFVPNENSILYGSNGIVLRDLENFSIIKATEAFNRHVKGLIFSPNKKYFVAIDDTDLLELINFESFEIKKMIYNTCSNANSVSFSPDGEFLAFIQSRMNKICIYKVEDFQLNREIKIVSEWLLSLSFSCKGNFLGVSSENDILLVNFDTNEICGEINCHNRWVKGLVYHPKIGNIFLSGSYDCTLKIWEY
ncbi:unnamed protein product [Blepharisma stoltei]|uniref:Uncharacterized protein n=1 Tax=Blepharisma stoltei TaxID=1481888 RepID=A0AAU9K168_9CILI|nr:unnamed protein product [Blepharisma stoltei]